MGTTRHLARLQFEEDGPFVEGEWTVPDTAEDRYTEWVGLYGTGPTVVIRLIEETDGREHVRRTELADAPAEKWAQLTEASAGYPEAFGPMVWGQSRWDSSVWGTEEDRTRLYDVFAILFPNVDRATSRDNHVRDAMHVSTAIRYGGFGFVTRERRLLNKADRIAERFQGFRLWPPEAALAEAAARIRAMRVLHRREPQRGTLPAWPTEADLPAPA